MRVALITIPVVDKSAAGYRAPLRGHNVVALVFAMTVLLVAAVGLVAVNKASRVAMVGAVPIDKVVDV